MIKITVLVDNNTNVKELKSEKALSIFCEYQGMKILFDTGLGGELIHNAELLGIDLSKITHLVLSHGHKDHLGGLTGLCESMDFKSKPELIAHPGVYDERGFYVFNKQVVKINATVSRELVDSRFQSSYTQTPYYISGDLIFLGTIPRGVEKPRLLGYVKKKGVIVKDLIEDDSALVFNNPDGLLIISGCSHSGVCNVIEYAVEVTGNSRVKAVIGGFHTMNAENSEIEFINNYLVKMAVESVYPCHCSGKKGAMLINSRSIAAGDVLNF